MKNTKKIKNIFAALLLAVLFGGAVHQFLKNDSILYSESKAGVTQRGIFGFISDFISDEHELNQLGEDSDQSSSDLNIGELLDENFDANSGFGSSEHSETLFNENAQSELVGAGSNVEPTSDHEVMADFSGESSIFHQTQRTPSADKLAAVARTTINGQKALSDKALAPLMVGDIIFQKSQSTQSKAIQEATGSEWSHVGILVKNSKGVWYVAEAVQPVKTTELTAWIARGKNKSYRVYRHPQFKASQVANLYNALKKYEGFNYDIYFEWSDARIYCSELVYKVFSQVMGTKIGQLQKFKDLKLDGPYVQALIKKRYTDLGKPLNVEESIVTPVSQMQDSQLILVRDI